MFGENKKFKIISDIGNFLQNADHYVFIIKIKKLRNQFQNDDGSFQEGFRANIWLQYYAQIEGISIKSTNEVYLMRAYHLEAISDLTRIHMMSSDTGAVQMC